MYIFKGDPNIEEEELDDPEVDDVLLEENLLESFDPSTTQAEVFGLISKVRKLVQLFHKSNLASDVLAANGASRSIPKDVRTRWNSTENMLLVLMELKESVNAALSDPTLQYCKAANRVYLTAAEWGMVRDVQAVLKPLTEVVTFLSGSKYVSISRILPSISWIRSLLKPQALDNPFKARVKAALLKSIEKYFDEEDHIDMIFCRAASFLDPATRDMIESDFVLESTLECLKVVYDQIAPVGRAGAQQGEATASQVSSSSAGEMPPNSKAPGMAPGSFQEYMESTRRARFNQANGPEFSRETAFQKQLVTYQEEYVDPKCPALVYWAAGSSRFPELAKVAKFILAVPATSVPSEASFSVAGNFIRRERARLSHEMLEQLTFLNHNWRLLDG